MAKQLSLSDRYIIERSLNKDYTFATIARILERSPSTISREILKYRVFVDKFPMEGSNDCTKRGSCLKNTLCSDAPPHGCYFYRCKSCPDHQCFMVCDSYEPVRCDKLKKPPYVCSGCQKQKSCKKNHAYYSAHRAEAEHKKNMRDSHSGIRKTPEELIEIGHIIAPLLNKGQSLNHICATHAEELGVSEEEVVAAMEELGISLNALFDPSVLTQLVLKLSGGQDAMALLTDEGLFAKLQNLTESQIIYAVHQALQ